MNKNKEIVIHNSCIIEFPRIVNEELWYYIMRYYDKTNKTYTPYDGEVFGDNPSHVIDTPTFTVRSYSWNDFDDTETDTVEKESDLYKHNNGWHFWHKPSGFKLSWYKYPLRDPYSNMNINSEQFCHILRDCQNSLHPDFIVERDEWWNKLHFIK